MSKPVNVDEEQSIENRTALLFHSVIRELPTVSSSWALSGGVPGGADVPRVPKWPTHIAPTMGDSPLCALCVGWVTYL